MYVLRVSHDIKHVQNFLETVLTKNKYVDA